MEYLSIGRSGLLTIMLPLNFLVGEYVLYFKLSGKSRKIIHSIVALICILIVICLIAIHDDPYYPFIIFGATVIGIIQCEWSYRKIDKVKYFDKIDFLLKKLKIGLGIVILFSILIIRIILPFIFLDLPFPDRCIAYFILIILGLEHIILNILLIEKFY
ncbi:hypothetical protein SAMN02910289_01897 [Lachnospiraceae bacterium RM5]|nr:hypothetical protein SAMN02910289_01897 [Lachnospiraceae bacterium RM5]